MTTYADTTTRPRAVLGAGDLPALAARLRSAVRVVVLTGAGVSRASGLPIYRGQGGIYENSEIESLHSAAGLPGNLPALWSFWGPHRVSIAEAEPNAAHRAIAWYQHDARESGRTVNLVTQNVDDLHERAGSEYVSHLNGTVFATRCANESCSYAISHDLTPYEQPPQCPLCGTWLRPALVLFGEPADIDAQWRATRAARECDLLLAVGTAAEVSTGARLLRTARDNGALCVSVDPARRVSSLFDLHVAVAAEDALPVLLG